VTDEEKSDRKSIRPTTKLEALGQYITLPRHVLPVLEYGYGSVIWIVNKT